MDRGVQRMREQEQGVRLSFELASAVRDQYAHQAHTIIIGDESHIGFYAEAARRVRVLTAQLRERAPGVDERAWVDEIERASRELDGIFRDNIVPAVIAGNVTDVREAHARAQLVVTRIQDRVEMLVHRFEAEMDALQREVEAIQRATFRWLAALLVGAPILAAVVTYTVGRSIARPLAQLREGAARLAAGDLDARIEIDSPDEFGDLARQWNGMTASLREHQEKLVETEKLAGIGRLAAGVAHEINNPLGVILGYAKLLRSRVDSAAQEDLRVIEDETLRCKEIVEGLLDLSRPLHATREPVELREVCDEVVARLRDARLLDGVEVRVEGSGTVLGHPSKVRQILSNLVRNAAEAAGPGGTVEVAVREDAGAISVDVRDDGPGIDATVRARLFEPFFTTKPQGTGLGLAVSRALARAHGGEVEASSSPGEGARFTFRLPQGGEGRPAAPSLSQAGEEEPTTASLPHGGEGRPA
ncbi:MAG TPA: HAMP domain-containing sensor histidine kinase [Anaeromyxobacteraceae bacterium]|nr:HAMP domain-containing sensor histidine kinase [Anaeromyxobacteraceae bacterium]